MISGIRDYKNYKTPNAQICFELENSGNHVMFYLSMSSLTVAQTNIYQKEIYLFSVVMGRRKTLSKHCHIPFMPSLNLFIRNPRILRIILSVVIKQLKHKVKK